jgi:diacylglycerol kinase family enzyme
MNLLLELPADARERAVLGAIGLGSSNDFHKPASTAARLRGIPLRGAVAGATFPNILRVAYEDGRGRPSVEHALTSCSLGLVALGNELHNSRSGPIRLCRRLGPSAGIWAASLAAVSTFRSFPVTLHIDGALAYEGEACLIGFYLSRHFAGSLKYPTVADGAGSKMGVVVLPKVTRGKCLQLLARAVGAGLPGPPETQLWTAGECRVSCEEPQPMEMDGEVVRAGTVTVRLVASTVRVCG